MDYLEWAKIYVKHKHIFYKESISFKEKDDVLYITTKKGVDAYISFEKDTLTANSLSKIASLKADKVWLLLNNTVSALEEVNELWEVLSENKSLRIWFLDLKSDKKWALNPSAHASITEPNKIKESLEVLKNNA